MSIFSYINVFKWFNLKISLLFVDYLINFLSLKISNTFVCIIFTSTSQIKMLHHIKQLWVEKISIRMYYHDFCLLTTKIRITNLEKLKHRFLMGGLQFQNKTCKPTNLILDHFSSFYPRYGQINKHMRLISGSNTTDVSNAKKV